MVNIAQQFLGILFFIFIAGLSIYCLLKIIPTKGRLNRLTLPHERQIALGGIIIALLYGIAFRYEAKFNNGSIGVMSFTFLFVVPLCMGILTTFLGDKDGTWGFKRAAVVPWSSAGLTLGASFLLAWEGLICIILFLPAFLCISSLGGLIGELARRALKRTRRLFCVGIMLLPLGGGMLEKHYPPTLQLRTAKTQIEIHSSPQVVWDEIKSVRKIEESEQQFSWSRVIGFPKPVEATLHGSGVGSYRAAIFEGNIVFHETIFEWDPEHSIAFKIRANTDQIPATTLDEHVVIGGPYFDVLEGRYTIEKLSNGNILLKLESTHKLATTFNFYAGFWSDFIMKDIQENILAIIKKRAENRTSLEHTS